MIILLKLPEKKIKRTCHSTYTNFPKYISILGKRDVKTAKLPTWSISNFNGKFLNFILITFGSRTTNSLMPHETNPISFWVSNPGHLADCSHSHHSTRCPVLPSGNSQSALALQVSHKPTSFLPWSLCMHSIQMYSLSGIQADPRGYHSLPRLC